MNLPKIIKVLGDRPFPMKESMKEYLEELNSREQQEKERAEKEQQEREEEEAAEQATEDQQEDKGDKKE